MKTETNKISEVELNKDKIDIGFVLYYSDDANIERWIVTKLFDGGFGAQCEDEFETTDFYFNELQFGWTVSEKTKIRFNFL